MEQDVVSVAHVHSELDANALMELLAQAGIPSMVKTFGFDGYLNIVLGSALYRGDICVNPEHAEQALELIGGFKGQLGMLEEAELPAEEER